MPSPGKSPRSGPRTTRAVRIEDAVAPGSWLLVAALLAAAAALTALSVWWQWAACRPDPAAADCAALRAGIGVLPVQGRLDAIRVAAAPPAAAAALTLLAAAWATCLLRLPWERRIRLVGAVAAVPLVVCVAGAWLGAADPAAWLAGSTGWILVGVAAEICGLFFLAYVTTAARQGVAIRTTQRLILLLLAVTAFGGVHQSGEFVLVSVFDPHSVGAPRYLGLGTATLIGLCAAGIALLTLLPGRRAPAQRPAAGH